MRRWPIALALSLPLLAASATGIATANADDPPAPRIAVLDVDRVRRTSQAVQSIREQLNGYMDAYRAETLKEEQDIRAAEEEIAGKRSLLTPDEYATERRKLEQRLAEAQGRVQRRREALERSHGEAMQRVQEALGRIVTEVAAEKGLNLILRKEQVVFVVNSIEITDEVLRRLNQQLPSTVVAKPGG